MTKEIDQETLSKMLEIAQEATRNAYCPYSSFHVGACILADDGNLYAGCNVENSVYGITQCAERNAIANMFAHGAKQIKAILVTADSEMIVVPCGACRQHIREFSALTVPVYMYNNKGDSQVMTVEELLPKSFGPEFLEK